MTTTTETPLWGIRSSRSGDWKLMRWVTAGENGSEAYYETIATFYEFEDANHVLQALMGANQ